MKLMTKEIAKKLPPLYHYEKSSKEPVAVVKYFDPTGSWSWYAAEGGLMPDGNWMFWGAVDGFDFEYGYFTLHQLEHAKDGCRGLQAVPIERDLHFTPLPLKSLNSNR